MINILRTKQVRLAQKSIPTGLVYKQNEEVLSEVGSTRLQDMLEARDWVDLAGLKVMTMPEPFFSSSFFYGVAVPPLPTGVAVPPLPTGTPEDAAAGTAQGYPPEATNSAAAGGGEGNGEGEKEVLVLGRASATAERVLDEDVRGVVLVLLKRLGTGKPLSPQAFERLDRAVERMLRDTAAEAGP
ncbi:unnamed protein product [Discosporangium mesarthrocarpum]